MLVGRGRQEGGAAYRAEVPADHSLLYSLMNAQRKDDGQPLSDLDICAQAFTFVLAGQSPSLVHSLPFNQCLNRWSGMLWGVAIARAAGAVVYIIAHFDV